jgi:hypothetical protein
MHPNVKMSVAAVTDELEMTIRERNQNADAPRQRDVLRSTK